MPGPLLLAGAVVDTGLACPGTQPKGPLMLKPYGTNPKRLPGYRNLDCPHYLFCLEHAVRLTWPAFSCQECPHQYLKQPLRAEDMESDTQQGWEDIWAKRT